MSGASSDRGVLSIGLVSEFPPPAAGMTVQAETLRRRLSEDGVEVVPVVTNPPFAGPLGLFGRVRFLRAGLAWCRFAWCLRRLARVHLVHVFASSWLNFFLFVAPAVTAGRLLRRVVVVHYHGGSAEPFLRRWGWLASPFLRLAHGLVVPSAFLAEVFAARGLEAEIIANPVDVTPIASDELADVPVVLSCRNLSPVYDIATAIDAFARFAAASPDARMIIAGDGPNRSDLERRAAGHGLGDRIEFLGNVHHDQMAAVRARATVLLNTSRADNQPVSLLEAMAAGLPIVSTDAGGIPGLVEHGAEALLAPVGDADALAGHLLRVATESRLRHALVAAGQVRSRSYRWRAVSELWYRLYDELLPSDDHAATSSLDSVRRDGVRS